jgi:hypothetical protein
MDTRGILAERLNELQNPERSAISCEDITKILSARPLLSQMEVACYSEYLFLLGSFFQRGLRDNS